ncbi:MAG: MotA/TolQ/ExbB proton channel family protein [Pirellulales bacterium]|nr:MotA/TolQ/ExbB proton channel family protein [Pirellulales bacterium]
MTRMLSAIWRSPLLWAAVLSVLFYSSLEIEALRHPLVLRYFAGHWVEYVETAAFFLGLCVLYVKWQDIVRQKQASEQTLLPMTPPGGQLVADCPKLLAHLREKSGETADDYLPRRLRDALEAIFRRGTPDKLDDELKYLSDLDAARSQQSYSLLRIIIWAIPILGFLGTVIGITEAIANLSPQQLEESLPEVTSGLGVAFDTTAIALAFSMVLMFLQHYVNQIEETLLARVDSQATLELGGRFPQQLSLDDPLHQAVQRLVGAILPAQEQLLRQQVQLWQTSLAEANEHWQSVTTSGGAQLTQAIGGALEESLSRHGARLQEIETAQQTRLREIADAQAARQETQSTNWLAGLDRATDKLAKQQHELARQGELLIKIVDATQHVGELETKLNDNLTTLATTQQLQETLLSLSATLQLLVARMNPLSGEAAQVELPRGGVKKSRGQAA